MTSATAPAQSPALVRRKPPAHVRRRRLLVAVADHSLLIVAALVFLAPFVFIVLTAFMTNEQALSPDLWPHPFRFQNFADVFNEAPLWRYALNSLTYGGLATLFLLASSIPVAYALAKLRWRGREAAFLVVLVAMLLPPQVTVIPVYVMWAKLHLVGSLWPLILPNLLGDAFSIFLLRQFFRSVPDELADAARVDGASHWQIMTRVIVPLAKPAIAAVALFNFLYAWNDFFAPLLYVGEDSHSWTIAIGLSEFKALHHVYWNLTMAASLLFMIPVIILFFLAQKVFIEGITVTGVKG